jgi:ion channel POLLUX/CASTOR
LLVQTSLFNGLVSVYEDLFSFAGSEIYFMPNTIGNVRFGDISFHLPDGIAIGYKCPSKGVVLNPDPNEIIEPQHRLILLMSDARAYHYHSSKVISPQQLPYNPRKQAEAHKAILIIGWNSETAHIISEYDKYISNGSKFHLLLTEHCVPEAEELETLQRSITSTIHINQVEAINEKVLKNLSLSSFDMLIVLTALVNTDHTEAVDSTNIKLLLMIRKLLQHEDGKKPLVVAEVLDTSNLELFDHLGISDFLLSNRLISIFLTQLAKQPELIEVYDRLLSKDGAEIYIKPISNYLANPEGDYTFADLVQLGQQCREIVIGYKKILSVPKENGRQYETYLNPAKTKKIALNASDFLIVISDES